MIISPADSVSVDDAIKTINEIQPNGGTNILQGFQKAFQLMRPYFVLSDDEGKRNLFINAIACLQYICCTIFVQTYLIIRINRF